MWLGRVAILQALSSNLLILSLSFSLCVWQMVSKYGKIDILVNNAAIQHIVPSVTETTPEILESTYK